MKNRELLKRLVDVVLICLCYFLAARYYLEDYTIQSICWIVIGSNNVYDLFRRIKASKKEEDESISDDNHTDSI